MFCGKCGAEINQVEVYCHKCGTLLREDAVTDDEETASLKSVEQQETRRLSTCVLLAFAVGSFVLMVGCVISLIFTVSEKAGKQSEYMDYSTRLEEVTSLDKEIDNLYLDAFGLLININSAVSDTDINKVSKASSMLDELIDIEDVLKEKLLQMSALTGMDYDGVNSIDSSERREKIKEWIMLKKDYLTKNPPPEPSGKTGIDLIESMDYEIDTHMAVDAQYQMDANEVYTDYLQIDFGENVNEKLIKTEENINQLQIRFVLSIIFAVIFFTTFLTLLITAILCLRKKQKQTEK